MAAEMFGCEYDRYDKKQRPCNLYTLVGVLMALLESIFLRGSRDLPRRQLLRWACGDRHLRAG